MGTSDKTQVAIPSEPSNEWIKNTYYPTLDTAIGTSYSYMHTTINWTVSLLTAVVLFVVVRDSFPDALAWIILSASLVLISHFAIRSGKGYLNTMRWATIQWELIHAVLDSEQTEINEALVNRVRNVIQMYHVKWHSPLPFFTVIYKIMFELGFIYMYALVAGLMVYIAWFVQLELIHWIMFIFCVMILLAEFTLFRFSPYLRRQALSNRAEELR